MRIRFDLRPLLLVALVCAAPAAFAAPQAGCTIVAGGGRTALSADPQMNDRWNRLNFSYFDAAAEAVREGGDVEQAFFPAGSTDAASNSQALLAQASKAGCLRVAQVAVYNDASRAEPELVFSLRVSPIRPGSAGAPPSVGAAEYEKEYRYPATPESFDQVVPSRIADRAVREYRQQAAAGTVSVYIGTGAVQCTPGATSLAEHRKRLLDAGIEVRSSSCGTTGRMYAQRCGAPTGDIHIFEIPAAQQEGAIKLQFSPLSTLPEARRTDCPS